VTLARPHPALLPQGEGETFTASGHVTARRLEGCLRLVCASDESGLSFLSEQSFSAPFHLSKPYWDGHALIVQVVNPTAGLFADDRSRSFVRVERGARLHLTTPSASRVHTMRDGQACLEQSFHVAAGGWLECSPAPLIPQRGSRYRQHTIIEAQSGSELFFTETLAPGRVAHGEVFQFAEIDWKCDVRWSGRLIAHERYRLGPDCPSIKTLREVFPAAYYASSYLLTDRIDLEDECLERVRQVSSPKALVGLSRLPAAGWSIRYLAADSIAMLGAQAAVRRILAVRLPELQSVVRKV